MSTILGNVIDALGRLTSKMRRYADRPITTHEVSELIETVNTGLDELDKITERDGYILRALYATVISSPENKKLFDHYLEEAKNLNDRAGEEFENGKDDTERT